MGIPSPYEIFLRSFGTFTEIQQLSLSAVGSGKNCLIIAPTGSGKTEAALIPVLNKIYNSGKGAGIQALYITPLRALNRDLLRRLEGVCRESGININVRHGDTTQMERKKQAESPPSLLITTPESLQNLFLSGRIRKALENVRYVIVDEIHELYYNKRGAQLAVGLERLRNLSGEFQRIGISATVGNSAEVARFLFSDRGHQVVRSQSAKQFEFSIEMPVSPASENKKFADTFGLDAQSLARIERVSQSISESAATIVFANTRQVAESLGSKLLYLDREAPFGGIGVHHSSLDREERVRVENLFKDGKIKGIVATSSLELGIDVGRVDLVLQYGSPKQAIRLIQRVGRAGHAERRTARGRILVAEMMDAVESEVICANVLRGELEAHMMESGALDVAVNQICAMVLEHKKIEARKAYGIMHSAAPYSEMDYALFERLLAFANELRLVRYSDGIVSMGSRSMNYFFGNISVIPDSIKFTVKNVVNNKVVSSLDENFVYNYLDPGSSFISKGVPWRVVSVEEGTIFVEPSSDIEAAVPDWEGEDIPVSQSVASAVFSRLGEKTLRVSGTMNSETHAKVADFVSRQRGHFIPSNETIFVEELESYAVIYVALGKLANEFLSRAIGTVLAQGYPGSLIRATPYAIVVEYGDSGRKPDIAKIFALLCEGLSQERIRNIAAGSDLFRYKFVQVAKLFGIVDKKAALTKSASSRLIDFYRGTAVFDETLRDIYRNNFDVGVVNTFLRDLKSGRSRVETARSVGSPLSQEILRSAYHYKELLMPNLPTDRDLAAFKSSMECKEIRLLCTFCGFVSNERISLDSDEKYLCHSCRSPMLAMYKQEYDEALSKKINGKRMGSRDVSSYEEAIKEAGMISAYGNRAVIALETYGVGISTAARVLKYMRRDFRWFFADLLEAQKTFVRTKRYWKRG